MYYETKYGDDEMLRLNDTKSVDENEGSDSDDDQSKVKNKRKRRRNEASMLEQENAIDRLSNTRPKRAAGISISIMFL